MHEELEIPDFLKRQPGEPQPEVKLSFPLAKAAPSVPAPEPVDEEEVKARNRTRFGTLKAKLEERKRVKRGDWFDTKTGLWFPKGVTRMDLQGLTMKQLIGRYNAAAAKTGGKPVKQFHDRKAAAKAIQKIEAKLPAGKERNTKRAAMKIVVLAKENPRKEGTDARDYFERLKASATVGDYMNHYKPKGKKATRDARLWLYFNIRDGHAKLEA
jgi:hypothetical protein